MTNGKDVVLTNVMENIMEIKKGTVVIDLEKTEDELMANMDKDLRWSIRKGTREHIPVTTYENVHVVHLQTKDYKPSSMAVFKVDGDTATLLATNTDSEFKKLQGNSLAYWEIIKWAKQNNIKKFDLGGIDLYPTKSQERINQFKKDFGGEVITYEKDVSFLHGAKGKI